MDKTTLMASVDEVVATFAADAASKGPLLPLASLLARLRSAGPDARFWGAVGDAMTRNGFAEPAAAVLAAGLQQHPRNAELLYLRGNALRVSARYDEAEPEFRAALALSPPHRNASLSLAFMLRELGRVEAAAQVAVGLWQHHREDPDLTVALLEFLRECAAHASAGPIAMDAQARWPQHARIAALAGELALALGDFPAARDALRRAVELDPGQSSAWLRLSYCTHCDDAADPDLALLEGAWRNDCLAPASRICAGFGLAKLRDDLDDAAQASTVLREANALARTANTFDVPKWRALVERQLATRSLPTLDADPTFVPIFVVGLPRTGTTLVATRLARHAQVHDRGELNWIGSMHAHLAGQDALANRGALQSIAALITTQVRRDDAPARYYIDKNPLNFRYLNLVHALFPNARVIHCQRGMRDTALSLWSQHFAHPDLAFSYDFDAIAQVAADHDAMMRHWRTQVPLPILDVSYEALVAEPDAQLNRLADFLELPSLPEWGSADIAATQVIATASVWQARQPVYSHAVGRWKRYAEFVPELVTMFSE